MERPAIDCPVDVVYDSSIVYPVGLYFTLGMTFYIKYISSTLVTYSYNVSLQKLQ